MPAYFSCEGEGVDIPPCTIPVNIEILESWDSIIGENSGIINVEATRGNGGYEYSLNDGPFQSTGEFADLAGGAYTVTVRDRQGCSNTVSITLEEIEIPSFANDILPVIETRCSIRSCHDGGRTIFEMKDYDDVNSRTFTIRTRVINRTMPPRFRTALTDDQISSIVNWINGGAPNN